MIIKNARVFTEDGSFMQGDVVVSNDAGESFGDVHHFYGIFVAHTVNSSVSYNKKNTPIKLLLF